MSETPRRSGPDPEARTAIVTAAKRDQFSVPQPADTVESHAPIRLVRGQKLGIERAARDGEDLAPFLSLSGNALVADAEFIVYIEARAREFLVSLTSEQLALLPVVGLLDDGWRRMYAELARREVTS